MMWDNKENREKVAWGWKVETISTAAMLGALFFIILILPSSEMPDEFEHDDGKTEKLDNDNKKFRFKIALLLAIALVGVIFISFFRYVWKKS